MSDVETLQARVASMADAQRAAKIQAADTNRQRAPEFAAFVDDFKRVFGDGVRVRWVRWADGTEQGRRVAGA